MKKEKKIKVWYILLFALIQFPLKLAGGLRYLAYIYIYFVPLLYLIFNINWLIKFCRRIKNIRIQLFKVIYAYLIFISIVWPIALGTFDFTYLTVYWGDLFLWLLKYLFLVAVFELHVDSDGNVECFIEYLARSVGLYVLVSLLCVISPSLRQFIFDKIYLSPTDILNYTRAEYRTRFGWAGWSSFNETAICTITVIILCIYILKSSGNIKKQTHYLVLSVFPLLGNALYGRIGLLTSLVCIGLTCIFVLFKGNLKYIFRLIVVAVILYLIFIMLKDKIEMLNSWYQWVFSIFVNYRKTGKLYDNVGSVQHLTSDMYWMPKSGTFLFGDGYYTNSDGTYYMSTDSGIMRPMLFYGMINYALSVFGALLIMREFAFEIIGNSSKKNIKFTMILLVISLMIFEFKGESLWMFLAVIIPIMNLAKGKKKNVIKKKKV